MIKITSFTMTWQFFIHIQSQVIKSSIFWKRVFVFWIRFQRTEGDLNLKRGDSCLGCCITVQGFTIQYLVNYHLFIPHSDFHHIFVCYDIILRHFWYNKIYNLGRPRFFPGYLSLPCQHSSFTHVAENNIISGVVGLPKGEDCPLPRHHNPVGMGSILF